MSKINRFMISIILSVIIFILFLHSTIAMLNPAAVYCDKLGYEYIIGGICKMSDGTELDAWKFLEGKDGQEYSYCKKEGYILKTINDSKECSSIFSVECAVCLKDGKEIEVTKLMNLSFNEGICGDGKCVIGENFKLCPQDCKSGLMDGYCDGLNDTRCDPDCERQSLNDPDCLPEKIPKTECINNDNVCYCGCIGKDNDCENKNALTTPCLGAPKSGIYEPEKVTEKEIHKFNWLIIIIPIILLLIISIVIFIIYKKKLGKKNTI